jgi:CHAT domain-containing protein
MALRFIAILIIILSASFLFYRSNNTSDITFSHIEIQDYVHAKGINPIFNKADTYKYNQDYLKAVEAFKSILSVPLSKWEKEYAFNQLAYIYVTMNEDSLALEYITGIEQLRPLSSEAQADYDYNVGVWAYHTFKPKMAEGHLQKALVGFKHLYGDKHLKVGLCLTQLGMSFYEFGQTPDSAFKYLPLAYDIFQQNDFLRQFSVECELGMSQTTYLKFENEKALGHIENALTILKTNGKDVNEMRLRCLSQKGNIYQKIGFLESDSTRRAKFLKEAEIYLVEAVKKGQANPSFRQQEFLQNMLVFSAKAKNNNKFDAYFKDLEQILMHQKEYFASPERLKAIYFKQFAKTDSALYYYRKYWANHYLDSLDKLTLLEASGALKELYSKKLNFDSSLFFSKQNILLATNLNPNQNLSWDYILSPKVYSRNKFIFISYFFVAQTLNKKYQKTKDIETLKLAFKIAKLTDENLFKNIFSSEEESVIAYQKEYGEMLYTNALNVAYLLHKKTRQTIYLDHAFIFAERLKSILLFRNIVSEKSIISPNTALLDSIKELNFNISQIKWERDYLGKEATKINMLESKLQKIYSSIEHNYPDFYKSKIQQTIPSIYEIQKKINKEQVFLHYTLCPQKWYRLAVSKTMIDFQEFDSTQILTKQLQEYKYYLKTDKQTLSANKYYEIANTLYEKLFKGLNTAWLSPKNLIIIPDRQLIGIPFEALTLPQKNKDFNFKTLPYLVNEYAVEYSPSWKIFQGNINNTLPTKPKTAYFSYDDQTNELPYAHVELEAIQKQFGEYLGIYKGNKCNKNQFFEKLNDCDILHISLHASSDPSNKFNNKIYFKNSTKDTLYGFELLRKNSKIQLLVLSACETAEGKIEAGEGVYSLSRYFQQCGVKNIIASLWKIDDATTSQVLSYFYDALADEKLPAIALQKAKIRYIKANAKEMVLPKYWAGLINTQ